MSNRLVVALLAAGFLLAGCSGSSSDGIGPTDPTSGNGDPGGDSGAAVFRARFVPAGGVFPYPTDFYFSGSTDGTLNLPLLQTLPNADELNALDGYSTVATATARFSAPIDAASLSAATVIMLEVAIDNATKATIGFSRALVYGTDYTARVATTVDSGGSTLEIVPLKPLTPSSGASNVGYLVVLTNGITDTAGNPAAPDDDYLAIKAALPSCESLTGSMNGICLLTGAQLQVASAVLGPEIVSAAVLTFSFSTQATQDTMNIAATVAQPGAIAAVGLPLDLSDLNPALPPVADLYAGSLAINYYLDAAAPLTGTWEAAPGGPGEPSTNLTRFNPVPVPKSALNIPLFVTVPNVNSGQAKPVDGWPVVIFQHGLRGNRLQSAAIAAAYAGQGFVVAAIDIPLHGLTDTANPFYQAGAERTFDLDLVDNATGAQGPDGVIDPSGSYVINLSSLLTSRDNLRQAALDIVQLAKSLPSLDLDGDTVPDIDGTRIHFAGLSLGGIVGTVASAAPTMPAVSAYLN
ncbi:MAG TPA: Ig-like domain-containing protein, partial [Steroidobacteraceae bacterium]|nr:Ig-like domain-containing protein [Steroidobacteraceae bacterium]